MTPPFADEYRYLDITASRVVATLGEKGIKYGFCGGYAAGFIVSQRVTKDIDVIASKDPTEAFLAPVAVEEILSAHKDLEGRWELVNREVEKE